MWCCLCDPLFSRFSRTPTCDRQMDTGPWLEYHGCIASCGKIKHICIILHWCATEVGIHIPRTSGENHYSRWLNVCIGVLENITWSSGCLVHKTEKLLTWYVCAQSTTVATAMLGAACSHLWQCLLDQTGVHALLSLVTWATLMRSQLVDLRRKHKKGTLMPSFMLVCSLLILTLTN